MGGVKRAAADDRVERALDRFRRVIADPAVAKYHAEAAKPTRAPTPPPPPTTTTTTTDGAAIANEIATQNDDPNVLRPPPRTISHRAEDGAATTREDARDDRASLVDALARISTGAFYSPRGGVGGGRTTMTTTTRRDARRAALGDAHVARVTRRGEPEPAYKEFWRQECAFAWGDEWDANHSGRAADDSNSNSKSKSNANAMQYFSAEDAEHRGRRKFIASTLDAFWARYVNVAWDKRHFYELIRADRACHLYYDLEYSKRANPSVSDADGRAATDALISLTLEELAREEGIKKEDGEPLRASDVVVELQSTSAAKFSRHLVFKLPGAAFANAAHVGHFVRRLWKRVAETRETDPRCALLFVRKDIDDEVAATPFVDLGVYTRNRAFRVYLSSKFAKRTRLLPTHRLLRVGAGQSVPATEPDRGVFCGSLASVVDDAEAARVIEYEGVGTRGAAYTGRVLRGFGGYGGGGGGVRSSSSSATTGVESRPRRGPAANLPCPETVAFVCRDFDAWSAPGSSGAEVRTWAAYPDHGVVVLNMQGNRFCENVDRAHKSNNVVFAIDLREGAYYQRCHDPECRGYRGRYRALPSELAREAVALRSLGGGGEGEGEGEGYAPPRIDSDDDDDEDGFWAAAAAATDAATPKAAWEPPAIDDDEAFWEEAVALVERTE